MKNSLTFFIISTIALGAIFLVLGDPLSVRLFFRCVLISGASTLLFHYTFVKFLKGIGSRLEKSIKNVELTKGEKLVMKSQASLMNGLIATGGVLFLTSERLLFKPHKLNFSTDEKQVPVNDISHARINEKDSRFFDVVTKSNGQQKYIVKSPSDWVSALSR